MFLMLCWFRNSIVINTFYNRVSKDNCGRDFSFRLTTDLPWSMSICHLTSLFSDSLSLLSVVTCNASKRYGESNCGIFFKSLILAAFLGAKSYLSPLSEWLFSPADSFTLCDLEPTTNNFNSIISAYRFSVSVIVCSFWCLSRFCDLLQVGMHDKLTDFEITWVSFIFKGGVSSKEFNI